MTTNDTDDGTSRESMRLAPEISAAEGTAALVGKRAAFHMEN